MKLLNVSMAIVNAQFNRDDTSKYKNESLMMHHQNEMKYKYKCLKADF